MSGSRIKYSDLVDIPKLQALMERFSQVIGIASAVIDVDGVVLVRAGWQDACAGFHRVNAETCRRCIESDSSLVESMAQGIPYAIYRCHNGLLDAAAPIVVAGRHLANVFAGQFLTEVPDIDAFRQQARQFGFDEASYLAAISRIPVLPGDRVESITRLYAQLAGVLADNGLSRREQIKTAKALADLNESLEEKVAARTLALERANAELALREASLKESEERFQALSTMSSDWFWQQDEQFRFVEFTGAFSSGFTPLSSSLGKTRWEHNINLTPAQWAPHRATLAAHLPFRNLEYAISGEQGEVRWYSISGEPLFDKAGKFTGYHGTGRNITALKLNEQELRIAATAFESQEGTFVTDADRVILRVNRAFSEITGYSANEAVGQTPNLLSSGRHDAAFYEAMAESIERHGTWQGEVWNRRKNGEVYPEWLMITAVKDDARQATHYVGIFSDITARKKAEEEINSLAFYDPLTGLPNRRLLLDRLKHVMATSSRSARHGALLFIDLDNFKNLNDTLGHDIGDLLLKQVAQRLSACVREGDTVARLGGDEFVVMLEDLSENAPDAANLTEAVGEKILAALNLPYQLDKYEHHSTPSIGVTLFADHRGVVDDLMKRADLAMYQAKAGGRNTLRFFDPEMQAVVTARVVLEAGLREAILQQQFHLCYQAQVDGEGRLTGAEALLRWRHPQRGLISPIEFIPVAEETGLILSLGNWVLETACLQMVTWAARPETAHLAVAVNVSARQLHHPDFVAQVLAVLDRTGANPRRLKLELTESLLIDDVEDIIAKMSALKARGIGFSLDDFGTGYSSLSYLKRLPLEQLKIDGSFVRDVLTDPNDAAIARTVVALAHSLGLSVIAEGVETEAQRDFLFSSGCHAYQGYFFSRPLSVDDFDEFARRPGGSAARLPVR